MYVEYAVFDRSKFFVPFVRSPLSVSKIAVTKPTSNKTRINYNMVVERRMQIAESWVNFNFRVLRFAIYYNLK